MTISNTSRTAGPFIGNGITTSFPFSYKVFERDDVLVATTVTATGVEKLLTLDADYAVILNADQNSNPGGVIRTTVAPPVGTTLAATSNIKLVQSLDLTNQGGFYPKVINDALDRMVINIQQLAGKIGQGLNIGSAAITDAALQALAFAQQAGGASGAAIIKYARAGVGAIVRSVLDRLLDLPISVEEYGAVGDGVTDDTAAIKRAFADVKSGGVVELSAGKRYRVKAGQLVINKSMMLRGNNAELKDDATAGGSLLYIARTADTPPGDVQPFYTLSRIKITDLRISGAVLCGMDDYTNGAARGTAPDVRTSTCDGIYMEDVDAIIMENVQVRSLRGAGMVFGDKSSVRESTFENVYILNCGNSATQRPSILFRSPLPSANNGIHNHIYFEHLRVVDSFWRSIEVSRGAQIAAPFGSFILEFNHCQLDNALPVGPVGPDCEMVLIEHCGWHISFSDCVILNPYGPGGGKWGYPCVRIGTDNYPNSTVERVEFINTRFQHATYGVGVQVARANVVRFVMDSWASDWTSRRSVVVANFDPTANYGVCTDVFVTPYLMFDSTNDLSDKGVFYANPVRRTTTHGGVNKSTPTGFLTESFQPGGYSSGRTSIVVPATANTTTVVALKDFSPGQVESDIDGTTWLISATAALADGTVVASGAAVVTFVNANIVGVVFPLGAPAKTDPAKLDLSISTPGGFASGGFIPGNGNRVQFYVGNPDGVQTVNLSVSVMRWGS